MSDGAIIAIVTGVGSVVTTIVTFLTLWVRLKYGVEKAEEAAHKAQIVERKLDENTSITTEAKDAATSVVEHSGTCTQELNRLATMVADHHGRIGSLEAQMAALKLSVDNVSRGVDSTRHEMRGHLQAVTNKLDLIMLKSQPTAIPQGHQEPPHPSTRRE